MKIKKISCVVFMPSFFVGVIATLSISYVYSSVSRKDKVEAILPEISKPEARTKMKVNSPAEKPEVFEETHNLVDENDEKLTIKLLETGEGFHGDEIFAKSGESWLGLFENKHGFFLKRAKVKIRRVYDPVVDGYENAVSRKTGKNVSPDIA